MSYLQTIRFKLYIYIYMKNKKISKYIPNGIYLLIFLFLSDILLCISLFIYVYI